MKSKKDIEKMLKRAQLRSNEAILSMGEAANKKVKDNSLKRTELALQIAVSSTAVSILRMILSDDPFDKEDEDYFLSICG